VLIPGTISTPADMGFFRAPGWDVDLAAHHRRGWKILVVCGGYQMLGYRIDDPDGIDGASTCIDGLGLLNISTRMKQDKTVRRTQALCPSLNCTARGYEIHAGDTTGIDVEERPFFQVEERNLGAISPDGSVMGGYVHGMFEDDRFRASFLATFRSGEHREMQYAHRVDEALDVLAETMEHHLDVEALWESMST